MQCLCVWWPAATRSKGELPIRLAGGKGRRRVRVLPPTLAGGGLACCALRTAATRPLAWLRLASFLGGSGFGPHVSCGESSRNVAFFWIGPLREWPGNQAAPALERRTVCARRSMGAKSDWRAIRTSKHEPDTKRPARWAYRLSHRLQCRPLLYGRHVSSGSPANVVASTIRPRGLFRGDCKALPFRALVGALLRGVLTALV